MNRFRGYGVLTPPKLPFPIDLLRRRYNSVRTAMRHCDSSHLLSGWLPIFHQFFLEPTVTNPQKFIKGCDAEQGSFLEAVFSLLLTAIHAAHCIAIHNFLSYHRHTNTHTHSFTHSPRARCTNAQLTIWLANQGLTLTAQLTRCRVARSTVN